MRKHWIAVLSMLGLAGSTVPVQSQVVKGKENAAKKQESIIKGSKLQVENNAASQQRKDKWAKANAENKAAQSLTFQKSKTANASKLKLNQQTLRQQNQGASNKAVNTDWTAGGGKNALTKAKGKTQAGEKNALTKAGLTKTALTKAGLTKAKSGSQ